MRTARVVRLDDALRARSRRVARATQARRRLVDGDPEDAPERRRRGGRAWLNGGELGGTHATLAHLGESYD